MATLRLYMALQDGHAEAVGAYVEAILNSRDQGIDKQKLLTAKDSDGTPGLFIALQAWIC